MLVKSAGFVGREENELRLRDLLVADAVACLYEVFNLLNSLNTV